MTKQEIFDKINLSGDYRKSNIIFWLQSFADQETLSLRTRVERLEGALRELVECKSLNAESQSYMKTDEYYAKRPLPGCDPDR